MKPVRILFLKDAEAATPWVLADADGYVLARGFASIGDPALEGAHRTIVVVPGAEVLARWLDLPSGSPAQTTAAAAWAMRSDLATSPERTVVALGPAVPDQARLAVFADSARVEAWKHHADLLGAPADVVTPDHLLIPEPETPDALAILNRGDQILLRSRRLACSLEPELASLMAEGRPVEVIDPALAETTLIRAALTSPVNLLAVAGRRASRASWRRTAVLAAALVLSPLILILAAAARDDLAARGIDARDRAAATAALRTLPPGADPLEELNRRLAAAPPPGGLTGTSAALFTAVQAVDGAVIESLTLDGPAVRVEISYLDYKDLDAIETALNAAGRRGAVESTLEDAGRITSTLSIGALP